MFEMYVLCLGERCYAVAAAAAAATAARADAGSIRSDPQSHVSHAAASCGWAAALAAAATGPPADGAGGYDALMRRIMAGPRAPNALPTAAAAAAEAGGGGMAAAYGGFAAAGMVDCGGGPGASPAELAIDGALQRERERGGRGGGGGGSK
jgi:hypothetical protein